ncbi:eukaryotic translation elongation factor 1 epsilon-1 [Cimex lectularius]|uniref:Nuclear-export cofactor Arc1-like N-terminal domain-containing protein n=1 Tax=Cimex lectularius TaxID=79782 RepID=A0A8I6S605_CIMLE|nr:eukaryotic translation elongation factor 1 epsilon-1 [Cimex lectularius]
MLDTWSKPVDPFEADCLKKQWQEYSDIYLTQDALSEHSAVILRELNGALGHQSFMIGNVPTEVDEVMFQRLSHLMAKLSLYEKEMYIHLSRWFNTMQFKMVSPAQSTVLFSRSLLY